jgi:hypothetical protein
VNLLGVEKYFPVNTNKSTGNIGCTTKHVLAYNAPICGFTHFMSLMIKFEALV